MASTYSGNLAIELIGTGDQAGTWGNTTNTNLGTTLEQAIVGTANVTMTSATNTAITIAQNNTFQAARSLRLNLVGTISTSPYLYLPAINKQYIVNNGLANTVIVSNGANTGATGTSVSIPAGRSIVLFNDGANIAETTTYISNLSIGSLTINGGTANALSLTNVTISSGNINSVTSNASTFTNVSITSGNINNITSNASTFSNVTINGGTSNGVSFSNATVNGGTANGVTSSNVTIISGTVGNTTINAYTENVLVVGNTGATQTLNIANATVITANLTASCTWTMPTTTAGKSFILLLKTGSGSYTSTFTGVKWVGNTAPTITTTANNMDILSFIADGTNWYGNYAQGYIP
jgi:hypothetical protein